MSPGAEPRKPLLYALAVGTKDKVIMTLVNQVEVTMNGQKLPSQPAPAMKMTFAFEVLDVGENGQARIERTVTDVEFESKAPMPAESKAALAAVTNGLKGIKSVDTYSARGVMLDSKVDLDSVKSPELRPLMGSMQQSLAQLVTPFPEQAVGKGAKWKVPMQLDVNGMAITQETVFELVERTDEGGKLRTKVTQHAAPGPIRNPNAPGVSANLVKMSATGTGEIAFSFARPGTSGDLDLTSEVEMSASSLQGPSSVLTKTTMHLKMQRSAQ